MTNKKEKIIGQWEGKIYRAYGDRLFLIINEETFNTIESCIGRNISLAECEAKSIDSGIQTKSRYRLTLTKLEDDVK